MKKLYLDLRVVSSIPTAYLENAKTLAQYSGANTGNFAFRHALRTLFDIGSYYPTNYPEFSRMIAIEQPDSVIVSCANWLCSSDQYEKSNGVRANTLEKIDCPVISFGLGAQASSDSTELKLGPNTIRLAKVLAEKCNFISVRDEFTHSALNNIGITNAVVTGCPSNFINPNPSLGQEISARANTLIETSPSWADIRAHFSEFSGGSKFSGTVLRATLRLLKQSPSFYVIQSPVLLPFLLRENNAIPAAYLSNKPSGIKDENQLRKLLKSKLLHFSSIDAWLDFARTCDLSLGMRIHGNMIPLQAGVPSMVITHDSRTSGLSNFMGIPTTTSEKLAGYANSPPSNIFEEIATKMESYDKRRSELASVMVKYIEKNNLKANPEIINLC